MQLLKKDIYSRFIKIHYNALNRSPLTCYNTKYCGENRTPTSNKYYSILFVL